LPTMFAVPTVEPVRVTLQLPLPFRLQLVVVGVTALPELKLTVPDGTVDPDDAVLTIVAVQVDPWFTIMGVEQLIAVEVP
jgi:hypothetical protein